MPKYLLLLLILVSNSAWAACASNAQLLQGFFSLSPSQGGALTQTSSQASPQDATQLDSAQLAADQRLFFFSRVSGNNSGALLHRWRHNHKLVASVRLHNGSSSWQSWSAQALGKHPSGSWQVEVLDDHLCLLGRFELQLQATDKLLAEVRELLADKDVTGAKLTLKSALADAHASRADKRRWQHFMQTELRLAEVAADLRQQQLVAAEGRLESLAGKLHGDLQQRYLALRQQLDVAQQAADQTRLFRLIGAIHSLAISSSCPADQAAAENALLPLMGGAATGITRFQQQAKRIELTLTLPSGAAKQLNWPCQSLLRLP